MAMRLCALGFLVALVLCLVIAGHAASSNESREQDGSGEIVPKWRFNTAFIWSYDPAVGIYRRVGRNWDLGLQLSGRISTSDTEDEDFGRRILNSETDWEDFEERDSETNRYSFAAATELRRWKEKSRKLSLFYGLRLKFSYNKTEEYRRYDRIRVESGPDEIRMQESRTDRKTTGLGMAPLMGVDVGLLSHISAAIILAPVGFGISWVDRDEYRIYSYVDGATRTEIFDAVSDHGETSLAWEFSPKLYLSVDF